jgi:preprotein translocase subunit SecF
MSQRNRRHQPPTDTDTEPQADVVETTDPAVSSAGRFSGLRDLASRLYRGEAGIDVVGKRKIWYSVAAVILVIGIITVFVRPFNLGIEFKGGNTFEVPARVGTLDEVRNAVTDAGAEVATAQVIGGTQTTPFYRITTPVLVEDDPAAAAEKAAEVKQELVDRFGLDPNEISQSAVSGAWGSQVTERALLGTGIFLVAVVLYLALVFREWRMSVAALASLIQNLVLTATVYMLIGFEVTPSTVIGFLTILGFALYDVVVVFDKVRENTRGITGNPNQTYGEAANLAVNQTLMRSINTAVVALLPVGGLLFIGAGLLGAGTLKDLGLVLFVGMLAAVYSSIFFATPVLVDLKEQEPKFKLHKKRVLARRAAGVTERKAAKAPRQPAAAAAGSKAASSKASPKAAGPKAASPKAAGPATESSEEPAPQPADSLTGSSPRVGARPQARKQSGGRKPGGAKPGGRSKRR